jgi:hypothetical protein
MSYRTHHHADRGPFREAIEEEAGEHSHSHSRKLEARKTCRLIRSLFHRDLSFDQIPICKHVDFHGHIMHCGPLLKGLAGGARHLG